MLPRTRAILELAREIIERAADANPQDRAFLESTFTDYIAAVAYSEIESNVAAILDDRFSRCGDLRVGSFLSRTYGRGIGRIQKSDIADIAHRFGDECKALFNSGVNDEVSSHYRNLIECRHKLSHGEPSNETLRTAENGIAAAEHLLNTLLASVN